MVGGLGHDKRASRGVSFDDFVTVSSLIVLLTSLFDDAGQALITIGFVWVPNTDGAVVVFQRTNGKDQEESEQLQVPRPAACDGWWGYEYTA